MMPIGGVSCTNVCVCVFPPRRDIRKALTDCQCGGRVPKLRLSYWTIGSCSRQEDFDDEDEEDDFPECINLSLNSICIA